MRKKTLIIISAVVGLVIIGTLVFLFTRSTEPGTETKKTGFFSFLFPTSQDRPGPALPGPADGENGQTPKDQPGQPSRDLIQITNEAVAGAAFNNQRQKVYYFEKSTGHLYEINAQGTEKKQVTITTIPKIFDIIWTKDAKGAILRYLDTEDQKELIRTFAVSSLATSSQEISGVFLPTNTFSADISPLREKIFYLMGEDSTAGIAASFENQEPEQIFSSSFSEFLASWPKEETIFLLSKPSASAGGYLFSLNPETKALTKILGEIKGLTSLSAPFSNKILYSASQNQSFTTEIYDLDEKESKVFNYPALPEKCAFSRVDDTILYCAVPQHIPPAEYPDDWYQGLVFFNDSLWRIDLKNGSTKMLMAEQNLDIINLFLNEEETYLFFQNKKDNTLWSLKIQN